jgi:hypothetical protein
MRDTDRIKNSPRSEIIPEDNSVVMSRSIALDMIAQGVEDTKHHLCHPFSIRTPAYNLFDDAKEFQKFFVA